MRRWLRGGRAGVLAIALLGGVAAQTAVDRGDEALAAALDRFFAADAAAQREFAFDPAFDAEIRSVAGDARLRALAFAALRRAAPAGMRADLAQHRVRTADRDSIYTVEAVGERPARGWALVVAMHGGGAVDKAVNDEQWQQMQVYYRPHPETGGYLYVALRAPNDTWNGFYDDAFYPLFLQLVRQFVVCHDVDPDRVFAIGYSHGGYGAFAVGPKLPDRFAAVHASAAAPTDGESSPVGLHDLAFSFMVGGRDAAHGRRERCETFGARLLELRRAHAGHYQTAFTVVEGNGHTGLPDRDLLPMLLAHTRVADPAELWWEPTDGVVCDHYWLHERVAKKGQLLAASLHDNVLAVELQGALGAEARLDARRCDLNRTLRIVAGSSAREVTPAPSLRTLCLTLLERGDPQLAASWIVPLP